MVVYKQFVGVTRSRCDSRPQCPRSFCPVQERKDLSPVCHLCVFSLLYSTTVIDITLWTPTYSLTSHYPTPHDSSLGSSEVSLRTTLDRFL